MLWTRGQGARVDYGRLPIGRGQTALTAGETADPPSVWAMGATLIANLSLFSSLAFGALFLWLVAPGWPPPQLMHTGFGLVAFVIVSAGVSMVAVRMAAAANRDKRDTRQLWLAVGFGGNLAMIAIQAALIRYHLPDPFAHAYAAANLALVCYGLMQAFVGGLLCAAAFFRARSGLVSACLLYTSPSPRDRQKSRMPSSA